MKKAIALLVVVMLLLTVGCAKPETQESSTENTVPVESSKAQTSDSPVENNKEVSKEINVNSNENFVASGKRLVDMKEVSKKEFIKKYPFVMPADFETAVFYFEIPTELGLKHNEVENGYIRYSGNGVLHLYICKTKYVNYGYDLDKSYKETKHTINKTEVITRKKTDGDYRGEFKKNGYYYTFETSNINEEKMISALKDIIG